MCIWIGALKLRQKIVAVVELLREVAVIVDSQLLLMDGQIRNEQTNKQRDALHGWMNKTNKTLQYVCQAKNNIST